jgi:hypothetical protein
MDKWDACLAEKEERDGLSTMMDGKGMILFFKKGDDIFGAPEESRLVFAKLKSNDDDLPEKWKEEAKFIACNLLQSVLGQHVENLFGLNDLKDINLIDKDSAVDELMKRSKKEKKKKK